MVMWWKQLAMTLNYNVQGWLGWSLSAFTTHTLSSALKHPPPPKRRLNPLVNSWTLLYEERHCLVHCRNCHSEITVKGKMKDFGISSRLMVEEYCRNPIWSLCKGPCIRLSDIWIRGVAITDLWCRVDSRNFTQCQYALLIRTSAQTYSRNNMQTRHTFKTMKLRWSLKSVTIYCW